MKKINGNKNTKNVVILEGEGLERLKAKQLFNSIVNNAIIKELGKDTNTRKINGFKVFAKKTNYKKSFKKWLEVNSQATYKYLRYLVYSKINKINSFISKRQKEKIAKTTNITELEKIASQKNYHKFSTNLLNNIDKTNKNGYLLENNIIDSFINFNNNMIKLEKPITLDKTMFFIKSNNEHCVTFTKRQIQYKKLHKYTIKKYQKVLKNQIKDNRIKNIQKSYSYTTIDKKAKTIYNSIKNNYFIEYNEELLQDCIITLLENKAKIFYFKNKIYIPKQINILLYRQIHNTINSFEKRERLELQVVDDINQNYMYIKALFDKKATNNTNQNLQFINNIDFTEKQLNIINLCKLQLNKVDIAKNLDISKQLLNKHLNIIKNKIKKYCTKNHINIEKLVIA